MAAQLRVGDIGSVIHAQLTENGVPIDISTATVKTLKLKKPSAGAAILAKAAVFESTGVDGRVKYTTIAGDLDESGPWTGQVYIEMPTGTWHSEPFNFDVGANLS